MAKTVSEVHPITGDQVQRAPSESKEIEDIVEQLGKCASYSEMIRYLHSAGFKKSSIAHIITEYRGYVMTPQHVNNVLSRPLKGTGQGSRVGRPPMSEDPRARELIRSFPKAQGKPVLVKKEELEARRKDRSPLKEAEEE